MKRLAFCSDPEIYLEVFRHFQGDVGFFRQVGNNGFEILAYYESNLAGIPYYIYGRRGALQEGAVADGWSLVDLGIQVTVESQRRQSFYDGRWFSRLPQIFQFRVDPVAIGDAKHVGVYTKVIVRTELFDAIVPHLECFPFVPDSRRPPWQYPWHGYFEQLDNRKVAYFP